MDTRAVLLHALDDLLEHRHPGEVSLREVARHAGVSHGLPGYYFQDRRGLLTAYAAEGYRLMGEMQRADLGKVADQPAHVRMAELGVSYVNFSVQYSRRFSVMFQSHEVNLENKDYKENADRAFGALQEIVAPFFAGLPDGEKRAVQVMFGAWSIAHGAAMLMQGPRLNRYMPPEIIPELCRNMFYTYATTNLPPEENTGAD
ncbi:MAG: TetR/AcrR family transcriptional regulator [Rhodovibrionaceae bacterium]